MPVQITCPNCARPLNVPEEVIDRKVRCPNCKTTFVAVGEAEERPVLAPIRTPKPVLDSFSDREDEERPRRGSRRRSETAMADPKGVSVLGIISLVLGVVGGMLSLIPCLNFVGLPFVGIGLLLGIIGIFVSNSGKKSGVGLPIAGTVVSLLGLLISLAWIGLFGFAVKDAQEKQAQKEKEIREGPAISITALELHEQYKTDKAAANGKYAGKVLSITGTISEVSVERVGESTVQLTTEGEDDDVFCHFENTHKNKLKKLTEGQQITIRGRCKGFELGSLTVEECILD